MLTLHNRKMASDARELLKTDTNVRNRASCENCELPMAVSRSSDLLEIGTDEGISYSWFLSIGRLVLILQVHQITHIIA